MQLYINIYFVKTHFLPFKTSCDNVILKCFFFMEMILRIYLKTYTYFTLKLNILLEAYNNY